MAETEPCAPHETRMLALELAVEFVGDDARKNVLYSTEEVIGIARDFEAYLTSTPIPGFESPDDVGDD